MEMVFFLIDLALFGAGSLAALAGLIAFGGARRNGAGLLAAGCYIAVAGLALSLLPALLWERARTDNAFLGLWLISLLALPVGAVLGISGWIALRAAGQRGAAPRALALAAAGTVLACALLLARGPGAWQTGSGQFGVDIIAVSVAIGVAVFVLSRREAPRAAES